MFSSLCSKRHGIKSQSRCRGVDAARLAPSRPGGFKFPWCCPKKKVKVATSIYHDVFQLVVPGSSSSSTSRSSARECSRLLPPRSFSTMLLSLWWQVHCPLHVATEQAFIRKMVRRKKKHVVQRPRRSSACGARACVATETAFMFEYRVVSSSARHIHHDAFQLVVQGPRRMYVSHVCHACRRCTVWNSCILCVFVFVFVCCAFCLCVCACARRCACMWALAQRMCKSPLAAPAQRRCLARCFRAPHSGAVQPAVEPWRRFSL